MPRKFTREDIIKRAHEKHGTEQYDYSLFDGIFKNITDTINIICKDHGVFEQTITSHLVGKGCKECGRIKRMKGFKEFVEEATKKHKGKYTYPNQEYSGWYGIINIICPMHGIFNQEAGGHLAGHGCQKCGIEIIKQSKKIPIEDIIKKANLIHNEFYDYSFIENITNMKKQVPIKCPIHGIFKQSLANHLAGRGCKDCGDDSRRKSFDNFVKQANIVHNGLYVYPLQVYKNTHSRIKIICPKNHEFNQTPHNHLAGQGCPHCAKTQTISKSETIWLNQLEIPNDKEHRQVIFKFPEMSKRQYIKVDGYDQKTKTMYEYLGDFYHGNPAIFKPEVYNSKLKKTYGELYQIFLKRKEMIERNGYKLITIWGSDFIAHAQKNA